MVDNEVIYWILNEADPEGVGLKDLSVVSCLSPAEADHYSRLLFPKRRQEWLLGRQVSKNLLRKCVPGLLSTAENQITIANQPEGAPYVSMGEKRLDINLSLSHRVNAAAAAVCLSSEIQVGIDLEWIEDHPPSFYETFFTDDEMAAVSSADPGLKALWGSLIWSAKEAALKALGKGLRLDTRSVGITGLTNPPQSGWNRFGLRIANNKDRLWQGFWRQTGSFVLTIAIFGTENEPDLIQVGESVN